MKCTIEITPSDGYGMSAIGDVYHAVSSVSGQLTFDRVLFEKKTTAAPHNMLFKVWLSDGRIWRTDNLYDNVHDPLVTAHIDGLSWRNSEIGALRGIRDTLGELFSTYPSIDKIEIKHDA